MCVCMYVVHTCVYIYVRNTIGKSVYVCMCELLEINKCNLHLSLHALICIH